MYPESFYHIYSRGNNKEPIFYKERNYEYFLGKVKTHFLPHLDILAYCLMRNHFHFLAYSKENVNSVKFSNDLMIMMRSYTRGINKQENRTGSLFQQHTKVKPLDGDKADNSQVTGRDSKGYIHPMNHSHRMKRQTRDYPLTCFHYIHQNPLKAYLVERMEDYKWCSLKDYLHPEIESLCNRNLAKELLNIPETVDSLIKESYLMVDFE